MSYRPPKKTGTALMPQKGEEIEKYNKNTKVKIYTKEEIAAYVEEKRLEELQKEEETKLFNEQVKGKRI